MSGRPSRAFFEVVAQLLPVLFLAAIIEIRTAAKSERPRVGPVWHTIIGLALLALCETVALIAVMNEPTWVEASMCVAGLGAVGSLVLIGVTGDLVESLARRTTPRQRRWIRTGATLVAFTPIAIATIAASVITFTKS